MTPVFGLGWMTPYTGSAVTLFLFGRWNLKALLATHLANSFATHPKALIANQSINFVRPKIRMFQT